MNAWVVRLDGALLAVIVMLYSPPLPAAGAPLRVAVPLLPAVKLTPLGRLPLSLSVVAAGTPGLVVIVKLPDVPTVKVVPAGAGDDRRLVHREREGLGRGRRHAVDGAEGQAVDAAGACRGCAAQRGRTVGPGRKGNAAGQTPVLAERRRRVTRGRDREAAGNA